MFELTTQTLARAAERARQMPIKCRASRISPDEIALRCLNPEHPGGHVCRFWRRFDGALFGECALRSTGELCPAAIGRHLCHHLAEAVVLYLAMESYVAAEREAARVARFRRTERLLDGGAGMSRARRIA